MAFATMNASPPRTCRMRNAPPGKGKPHAKCSPWKGKTACEMLPLERENRMRNAPPGKEKHSRMQNALWKGKAQPHAKCPPWKGKAQPHAKCSPWKGKAQPHAKCSPWKGKTACEMLPPGKGFTSN